MSSSGGIQPEGGGGVGFPRFSGAGSPQGVQVGTVGDYYEDSVTGILYQKATGVGTNTGWVGAVQFDTFQDSTLAGPNFVLAADGASHNVTHAPVAPPAWIDGAGAIVTPGLYIAVYEITTQAAPTLAGKMARLNGTFAIQAMINLTDLQNVGTQLSYQDVASLSAADLPFAVAATVDMPTDVTATINAKVYVQRLMFPAP